MSYVVRLNNHYFGLFPDLEIVLNVCEMLLGDDGFDSNSIEVRVFPVDLEFDGLLAGFSD